MESVHKSSNYTEQRRNPRTLISLPVDFRMIDEPNVAPGLVINASEAGLLIQTFNEMSIGKRISIKVLFPKGTEFESFKGESEIIWKDTYWWEDWEAYQYGLKFIKMLSEDHLKLKLLLCGQSNLGETSFVDGNNRRS